MQGLRNFNFHGYRIGIPRSLKAGAILHSLRLGRNIGRQGTAPRGGGSGPTIRWAQLILGLGRLVFVGAYIHFGDGFKDQVVFYAFQTNGRKIQGPRSRFCFT